MKVWCLKIWRLVTHKQSLLTMLLSWQVFLFIFWWIINNSSFLPAAARSSWSRHCCCVKEPSSIISQIQMSWNIVCISAWIGDRGFNTFDFVWDRRFMEQILSIKMNPESWSETKQWPIKHLTDIAGKNLIVPMQWMHSRSEIPALLLLLPAADIPSLWWHSCWWEPSVCGNHLENRNRSQEERGVPLQWAAVE